MMSLTRGLAAAVICSVVFGAAGSADAQTGPTVGVAVEAQPGGPDPVAYAAYGELFDTAGERLKPTPALIRRAQEHYLARLLAAADEPTRAEHDRNAAALREALGFDEMAVRSLLIERLIEATAPPDAAHLYAKNRTLRMAWFREVLGEERFFETLDKESGLPAGIAEIGRKNGMLRKATTATGPDYIRQCEAAGVPTPPTWGEEGPGLWNAVGDLTTNFVGSGNPARVYRFDGPEGLCVALPRISGQTISLLGVICLGRKTGNVCFYDNAGVPVGDKVPMDQFLSGGNLGDVCSDCHAGENPYVVHPGSPLDMAPANRSPVWHTPLVRPDWPQNPGPSPLLGQVAINPLPPANDASCLSCHTQGNAGRFPHIPTLNQVSNALGNGTSGYCGTVVLKAMGQTMPGGPPHQKHVDAMKAFCKQSTPPGGVVDNPGGKVDVNFLSPPVVLAPLYACAEMVEVSGGVYDAKLVVRRNGADLPGVQVKQPSSTIVAVGPLVIGDVIDAYQEVNGLKSDLSVPRTVGDHTVAYPSGLPEPTIDPTLIHQCGRTIAVRHVRGAAVTVYTNGAAPAAYMTGGDWTNLPPAIRPFILGDAYSADQRLCADTSKPSGDEVAVAEPAPLPAPVAKPLPPVSGQRLITVENLPHGALTEVTGGGAGLLSSFSTAVSFMPEIDVASALGRALQPGDGLAVTATLCTSVKGDPFEVAPCRDLPPPEIAQPFVGDVSVTVLTSVPSARVLVFDASAAEIGDGSGALVGLSRPLVQGDVLTVTQELDAECRSRKGWQVAAVCASQADCKL